MYSRNLGWLPRNWTSGHRLIILGEESYVFQGRFNKFLSYSQRYMWPEKVRNHCLRRSKKDYKTTKVKLMVPKEITGLCMCVYHLKSTRTWGPFWYLFSVTLVLPTFIIRSSCTKLCLYSHVSIWQIIDFSKYLSA